MTTNLMNEADRATRRVAIERAIAAYPDVDETEIRDVLHYFKREASALDRATIASNNDIAPQYRRLCDEHYIDRLKPAEIAGTVALAILLICGVAAAILLY